MPVQVDTPIATGAISKWALWGSAPNKVKVVQTNDGDTSIVYAATGGLLRKEDYQFSPILGVADPVNSASLTAVTREYLKGAGGRNYHLRWNSTQVAPNRQNEVHVRFPNYRDITHNCSGAELGLAEVNGEHGMQFNAAGGPSWKAEFWVTHLYRTVDFDYGSGSAGEFAHLIGSLVGAILGSGLTLGHMREISRLMGEKRRVWLRPDEFEPALRAWNAQKRLVVA